METSKVTVHTYDYGHKNTSKKRRKTKASRNVKIFLAIIISCILIYSIYKYTRYDIIKEIDKKISMSLDLMKTEIKKENFDEDYLLVTFPDKDNIVSKNKYIISDIGNKYKEFESGYILMYKNGSYRFELQVDGYCATKDINNDKYQLLIFKRCSSKNINYLKK